MTTPGLSIDADRLRDLLAGRTAGARNLFAYPAQSKFSGVNIRST